MDVQAQLERLLRERILVFDGGMGTSLQKFKFTEAVSFFISVDTQDEVDYYWNKLTADGGEESMCGWLKDKFGLSWQVIPRKLMEYQASPDRAAAERSQQAMLKMRKIVIAHAEATVAAGFAAHKTYVVRLMSGKTVLAKCEVTLHD